LEGFVGVGAAKAKGTHPGDRHVFGLDPGFALLLHPQGSWSKGM
jgi:hypothetical protein